MQEKDTGILIEITCIYILPKIEVIANSYKKEKEYMYTCFETKYAASILKNTRKIPKTYHFVKRLSAPFESHLTLRLYPRILSNPLENFSFLH